MSGSENTWRNKDLESITKEITDTTQLNKNTIKRHISKFWNPKELSPSKRHCYVPLDCSVRHIVSFSTSPRGSHACSNWAFACSASLLPLPPIRTPDSLIWDLKCFVVKRYAHNKEQVACKWSDWASWKWEGGQLTMFKIPGSAFQPRRGVWSARTIRLPAPCGMFGMCQPESVNLAEMSIS